MKKSVAISIAVILIAAGSSFVAVHELRSEPHDTLSTLFSVSGIKVLAGNGCGRVAWSSQNVIAFSSFPGTSRFGSEIYTMAPDGSHVTNLTADNTEVPHINNDIPEWNPSGTFIVFESVDPALYNSLNLNTNAKESIAQGGSGIDNNLWLISADGHHAYQLTNITQGEGSLHPYFSPGGNEIVWSAREQTDSGFQWALKVAYLNFSNGIPALTDIRAYQPLGHTVFYESHGFTPDGRGIIFSSSANPDAADAPNCACAMNLFTLNLGTLNVTGLTGNHNVWNEHASITPDGKYILWVSSMGYKFTPSANWGNTLKTDYWIMDFNGSDKGQITEFNVPGSQEYNGDRVIVADSSWSPTGLKFAAPELVFSAAGDYSRIIVVTLNRTA